MDTESNIENCYQLASSIVHIRPVTNMNTCLKSQFVLQACQTAFETVKSLFDQLNNLSLFVSKLIWSAIA